MSEGSDESEWFNHPSFLFGPEDTPARPRRMKKGVFGQSRLAHRRELETLSRPFDAALHGLELRGARMLAEVDAAGNSLEPMPRTGLTFPHNVCDRHLLAVGTTGAGKTQQLILPALASFLADPNRTIIAIDAKGGVLYGFLKALADQYRPGCPIHQLNFKDASRNTIVWNPASGIRTRDASLALASSICHNSEVGVHGGASASLNEMFWINSSIEYISDMLLALADDDKGEVSLAEVKRYVDQDFTALPYFADRHRYSTEFVARYPAIGRRLHARDATTQLCIIADCATRLQLFGDKNVVKTTCEKNQLDLGNLIREGGILILEVPEAHARQLRPLTNFFVSQLLGRLMQESMAAPDGRLPRPCAVVLDELGSACGRLPDFDVRLCTLRSRGVAVVGAVQMLDQLRYLYGPQAAASVLDGFCTKIFFGNGLSIDDATYASRLSGTCTVESISISEQVDDDFEGHRARRVSRTRIPVARPVLLPEEIARPAEHPTLGRPSVVFAPAMAPFYAYMQPAYAQPELRDALDRATVLDARARDDRSATPAAQAHRARLEAAKGAVKWSTLTDPALNWWDWVEKQLSADEFTRLLAALAVLDEHHRKLHKRRPSILEELYQYQDTLECPAKRLIDLVPRLWANLMDRLSEERLAAEQKPKFRPNG